MAEFQEVMRQWVRVRKATASHFDEENVLSVYPLDVYDDALIADIEKNVMQWAADHPEPVYPTWEQVIAEMFLRYGRDNPRYHNIAEWEIKDRIPADIAQKLGIEPKAGGDT